MSSKAARVNPELGKMCVLGGREMTMEEYTNYLQALQIKPFLTPNEAAIFFNIGINKVYRLMKDPSADFVVDAANKRQYARIHRETFERWLLEHGTKKNQEV